MILIVEIHNEVDPTKRVPKLCKKNDVTVPPYISIRYVLLEFDIIYRVTLIITMIINPT